MEMAYRNNTIENAQPKSAKNYVPFEAEFVSIWCC